MEPVTATLKVSEIFESVQGEGASAGEPCAFLRLAVCNLRCSYCDTKYSWDFKNYDYNTEVTELSVSEILGRLPRTDRIVVTGGEPLLQQTELLNLLQLLPGTFVEVETNGTLAPSDELIACVDQWNVSPKLSNSSEPAHRRIRDEPLAKLRGTGRAWLKLVIENGRCAQEAEQLVASLGWPRSRVLLMPQAQTRGELNRRLPIVEAIADSAGFRHSTRLHIAKWDGQRGV